MHSCRPIELDETTAGALECHRLAYADLLHRWRLFRNRAQVLALLNAAHNQRAGVALDRVKVASGISPATTSLGMPCRHSAQTSG
jgi:hypothetical protein